MKVKMVSLGLSAAASLILAAASAFAADDAPSLGAIFVRMQSLTFRQELIWPLDLCADCTYGPDAREKMMTILPRHSAFLVGRGGGKRLTKEELKALEEWVTAGGNLIISGNEGAAMFGNVAPEWAGRKSWAYQELDPAKEKPRILDPAHPLVKGMDEKMLAGLGLKPLCLKGADRGTALIGAERTTPAKANSPSSRPTTDLLVLVWTYRCGKGQIIYLGGSLTPQSDASWKQCRIQYDLGVATITLWRNMVEYLKLPTRKAMIREWGRDRKVQSALWRRYEIDEPLGAALMHPPFPKEGEALDAIRFDLGRGDRYWQYFFLTAVPGFDRLSIAATDLRGPHGASLPGSCVEVFIQEPPDALFREIHEDPPLPGHRKSPYWLVPLKYVAPVGENVVRLPGERATTFWVKMTCDPMAAPGEYEGRLVLKQDATVVAETPIKATVWDLQNPEPETLHFEFEHDWNVFPGGYFIDKARIMPSLVAACQRHTAGLGVDFAQCTGLQSGYALDHVRLAADGRPFLEAIKKDPELLLKSPLPELDYSWFDGLFFDSGTAAGMRTLATNIVPNQLPTDVLCKFTGKADLDKGRLADWLLAQEAMYLKERGYPVVYCKTMDEFAPKYIDDFVTYATLLKKAGFRTYTTTPNFMFTADAVRKAGPVCDLWQSRNWVEPYPQLVKRLFGITLSPASEFWPYSASSYPGNKGFDWSRMDGWVTAFARGAGYHFHHYYRWNQDDRNGALAGPDDFYDAGTSVNRAMSIGNGRYLATLYRMLDYAKAHKLAPEVASAVEKEADGVVGMGEGAILRISAADDGIPRMQGQPGIKSYNGAGMSFDPKNHDLARRKIMELMVRLKKAAGAVKPTLKYGDLCLVQDGQARFQLACAEMPEAMIPFVKRVTELSGATAPVGGANAAQPIQISAGTLGNAALKALLDKAAPGRFTATYPSAGHYAIVRLPAAATSQIVIVGGDAEGVSKGIDRFGRFLSTENRW